MLVDAARPDNRTFLGSLGYLEPNENPKDVLRLSPRVFALARSRAKPSAQLADRIDGSFDRGRLKARPRVVGHEFPRSFDTCLPLRHMSISDSNQLWVGGTSRRKVERFGLHQVPVVTDISCFGKPRVMLGQYS
jgi:hypothetical protein